METGELSKLRLFAGQLLEALRSLANSKSPWVTMQHHVVDYPLRFSRRPVRFQLAILSLGGTWMRLNHALGDAQDGRSDVGGTVQKRD